MKDYGDRLRGAAFTMIWHSYNSLGASVTPSSAGTTFVYKNASDTQTAVGVTADAVGVDSLTGVNRIVIDSSASAAFYSPGNDFHVVKSTASIDGQFVNLSIGHFSVENRYLPGLSLVTVAAGGGTQSITFPGGSSATTNWYQGHFVELADGPGAGLGASVVSYAGATKVATVDRAWSVQPTSATTIKVFIGSLPATAEESADALLGRSIGGGSNSGRTVATALYPLRNKVEAGSMITVYAADDSTVAWTASATTAGYPLGTVDPA